MSISKRNRRGLVWLSLFGLMIVYTPRILLAFQPVDELVIQHSELIEVHNELVHVQQVVETSRSEKSKKSKYQVPPHQFDPNTYSLSDWMKLGLSQKQAEVVLKFSERGLTSNEDLARIFVMPKELLELIKDSTVYPVQSIQTSQSVVKATEFTPVDLNSADADALMTIPGIGPFYAEQIIKRRAQLGGFVGKEQLLEIWKFDDNKLAEITDNIRIESESVVQLSINSATLEELKAHPYISFNVANSIVKMREQKAFETIADIKRSKLIDNELFQKLKPYLRL